ncbi:hypothetical protein AVEN_113207-1 [Araneus ventricosus]|uniref:Uncharacterized protein n=1 Tax=Araneus ventricosus TaxID=182803 RepID=A0A4Y2L749_ARAVE|nr:hypothetical protein AVEN_113207-1 [Araneus ventricosus]
MVSFDDIWRPIACPWVSPYHCPSGIVLDGKSRLNRKEYVAPLLWSRAQCNRFLTCAEDKGTQTRGRRANSPPTCSLRGTVWQDMGLPAGAESCDASCRAVSVSGVWQIATGSDRLPLW